MDITSISTLIGSLKTATEIAKFIKETGLSLEQAETKLKLADRISTLADARVEVAGIQQELLEREEQIRELRKQLELKDALVYEAPSYWLHDESTKDGPFCQTCYDPKNSSYPGAASVGGGVGRPIWATMRWQM